MLSIVDPMTYAMGTDNWLCIAATGVCSVMVYVKYAWGNNSGPDLWMSISYIYVIGPWLRVVRIGVQ